MSGDKVELRGLCPLELAQALDAIAMAKGLDRNAFVVHVLTRKRVKPRPSGRGRKARSPSGLLWAPPINQQP